MLAQRKMEAPSQLPNGTRGEAPRVKMGISNFRKGRKSCKKALAPENQSTSIKQQPSILKSIKHVLQSSCQRAAVISRKSKHATDISCARWSWGNSKSWLLHRPTLNVLTFIIHECFLTASIFAQIHWWAAYLTQLLFKFLSSSKIIGPTGL